MLRFAVFQQEMFRVIENEKSVLSYTEKVRDKGSSCRKRNVNEGHAKN